MAIPKKTIVVMVTLELHPRLEEDLAALIKEYLESEKLLRVVNVATGNTLMTTDLPYVVARPKPR